MGGALYRLCQRESAPRLFADGDTQLVGYHYTLPQLTISNWGRELRLKEQSQGLVCESALTKFLP